jgi:hypothetical protein
MDAICGSCLCGDVAWEIRPPLQFMSHCHCGRCRKAHGSAFSTAVFAPADGFRMVRGAERVTHYESTPGNERPFCGVCGSAVPGGQPWNGLLGVPAGALDDDPGVRPIAHIFVGSKAPWYDVVDGIARFDAYPPGVDAPVFPDLARPPTAAGAVGGSCLCGRVAYVVTGPVLRAQHCHCSRCRKARAAAHASNFFTAIDGVRFTRGEDALRSYKVPDAKFYTQAFCGACGSPMPRLDAGRGLASVPMGSLDDDPGVRPTRHIYVGSKAPWYEIPDDGLPQFAEMPPTH